MKKILFNFLLTLILSIWGLNVSGQRDTTLHEIPWTIINDTNILWAKRVCRELDIYEKQNAPLRANLRTPQVNILANLLLQGIKEGLFKAWPPKTESEASAKEPTKKYEVLPGLGKNWIGHDTLLPGVFYANPLTDLELNSIIDCNPATLTTNSRKYLNFCSQHKNDTEEIKYEPKEPKKKKRNGEPEDVKLSFDSSYINFCYYPQQIDRYGIMETWIYDKGQGQMIVRIAALAPMENGKPLFWVKYPEIRKYLAQYKVYDGNKETPYNWDEYFESRQFESRITKVGKE